MAAVMQHNAAAIPVVLRHSARTSRQADVFVDRRALVDVLAVTDNVHPQGSDEEIWMISYMDIMTLLLTLFVLLLAFAKVTPQQIQVAAAVKASRHLVAAKPKAPPAVLRAVTRAPSKSLPSQARARAVAQPKAAAVPVQTPVADSAIAAVTLAALGIAPLSDVITPPLRAVAQAAVPLRQTAPATPPALPAVAAREKFLESVRSSALGQRIELSTDQDNVSLEISDNILFDPGSATLKQDGLQVLDELAGLLVAQEYTVSIEGHSDNVAFASAQFASNWELSATRATNVTRYLITHGIAAARLRAIGYADTQPRADNASAQGRARNRRVSLVLHMPVQATPGLPADKNQNR